MGLEPEVEEEVTQLITLRELLSNIDQVASNVEKAFECQVIILAFHGAGIERKVVDNLEFHIRKRGLQGDKDVCVVLHTLGGDADAAYHIGIRLQRLVKDKKLIMIVPRLAKSAGTLLACAGDKIYATPITELGPVDPQVFIPRMGQYVSAKTIRDSLRQVIETIEVTKVPDRKVLLEVIFSSIPIAGMGHFESLLDHVRSLLEDILSNRMMLEADKGKVAKVAEKLTKGYVYHGKVIHVGEALTIGLSIEVLEGERLDAVYNLYKKLEELFNAVDEVIEPLLYIVPIPPPPPRLYQTRYGLIYLPSLEKEDWLRRLVLAREIEETKGETSK